MSSSSIWPHLADRADIIDWAGRFPSGSELPLLVRRLIRADNDRVTKLNMRAEEGVWLKGYDGQVHAQEATPFVPAGESVWEMGTTPDIAVKANKDYETRTTNPGTVIPANTTFVFVTPRSWPAKDDWVASKSSGPWKAVIAHDVDSICEALEQTLELHYWFTGLIGYLALGIQTLESWWTVYSSSQVPKPEVASILQGREESANKLLGLIEAEANIVKLRIETIDELLAFYHASITTRLPDEQDLLFSRSFIVKDPDALRFSSLAKNHLALVPFAESLYREAKTLGRHSLLLVENQEEIVDVEVPTRSVSREIGLGTVPEVFSMPTAEVVGALPIDEKSDEEIEEQEIARALIMPGTFASWKIRILWLLGSWSLDRSGDRTLLEQLSGETWAQLQDELNSANDAQYSAFLRIGDTWTVKDVDESWFFMKQRLSAADLELFTRGVQDVLGAVDPANDTAISDRWASTLYGTERVYSRNLRVGVGETLAFLSARGEGHELSHGLTLKNWVRHVVMNLLRRANDDATGNLWESLGDLLSLLAEAAPEEFMAETKLGLAMDGSLLKKLFTDSHVKNVIAISNTQVNLLHALEVLSWKSEYLGISTEIMAMLSDLDTDGTSGSAPAKSLTKIFVPWLPQTNTSFDRQLKVIEGITLRHPKVGWRLLLSLLPDSHAIGFSTSGPKFNSWKPEGNNSPTLGKYIEATTEILNRAMEIANSNLGYWTELLQRMDSFAPDQRRSVIENLERHDANLIDESVRFEIYETLSQLVRKHREFPDAKWSLGEEELQDLSRVAQTFESDSIELKSMWLFNDQRPDLGIPFSDDDLPYQEELLKQRKEACLGIFEQQGLQGVKEFATQVKYPYFLGRSLASLRAGIESEEIMDLIDSVKYQLVNFSVGFIDELVSIGEKLVDSLAGFVDRPLVCARTLSRLDNLEEVWQIASDFGPEVEKLYWEEFQIAGRGADFKFTNEVARQLLDHDLALKAIDVLSLYGGRGTCDVDLELTLEALEAFAASGNLTDDASTHVSWALGLLLGRLVKEKMDPFRVATLEWKLLPALGYDYKSSSIENLLASNPQFFVDILSLVYRSDDDSEARVVDAMSSRMAFRALHEWSQVPGSDAPGHPVDGEKLKIWIAQVRELAAEKHRSDVAEIVMGEILAHSISDEDGSWPSLAIRDAIESSPNEKLGHGFVIGTMNLRGVFSRGLDEGGRQEYALAEKYEAWKNQVADGWPSVGLLLEQVAESYRVEGRREDERSHLWKEGLDT